MKLIGLERYRASGGSTRQDLFTEKMFLEAGLVDLIMAEVLTEAVERVQREGWAWVEVFESMGYSERERFTAPPYVLASVSIAFGIAVVGTTVTTVRQLLQVWHSAADQSRAATRTNQPSYEYETS